MLVLKQELILYVSKDIRYVMIGIRNFSLNLIAACHFYIQITTCHFNMCCINSHDFRRCFIKKPSHDFRTLQNSVKLSCGKSCELTFEYLKSFGIIVTFEYLKSF